MSDQIFFFVKILSAFNGAKELLHSASEQAFPDKKALQKSLKAEKLSQFVYNTKRKTIHCQHSTAKLV